MSNFLPNNRWKNIDSSACYEYFNLQAQQATELETLLPLQSGTNKLILVGDPKQLQPTVKSQVCINKKATCF